MKFFIIIKKNSQRVKKKNFQRIGKMELWQHLIKTLRNKKVFIDTDSNEIINKCKKSFPWVHAYKREKKFISMESKKNASPTLLMIKNFLDNFVEDPNEIVVTTHVTSPFLKLKTILSAVKKLNKYDSVASITKDYNFAWIKKKKQFSSN